MRGLREMTQELMTEQDADKLKSHRLKMQNFLQACHRTPEKIMTDQKVPYVPISYLETKMDEIFFGEWDSEIVDYKVIANSLTVSIKVTAKCPVSNKIITRSGLGAVAIRVNKGKKPLDFNEIQSDSIKTGLPAAKAFAFKNAIQSLGKVFGRDLARNEVDSYNPLIDNDENPDLLQDMKDRYSKSEHNQKFIDSMLLEADQRLSKEQVKDFESYMNANYKKPGVK